MKQSISELRRRLELRITADDILSAVLHASGRHEIPKSNSFLHKTVYKLKGEYPELFRDFLFDESGISPFSEDLDGVLFRLETSGILAATNPSYSIYIVNHDCGELISSYEKLFRIGMEDIVKECAARLCALIDSHI